MLKRLLERVAQGGIHSTAALAHELGVSQDLLAQMVDDLVRLGYLKAVEASCSIQCAACPAAGGCSIGGPGGVWSLVEGRATAPSGDA